MNNSQAIPDELLFTFCRQYLVNYLREFCHQPYFSHFAPHLTQQEVSYIWYIWILLQYWCSLGSNTPEPPDNDSLRVIPVQVPTTSSKLFWISHHSVKCDHHTKDNIWWDKSLRLSRVTVVLQKLEEIYKNTNLSETFVCVGGSPQFEQHSSRKERRLCHNCAICGYCSTPCTSDTISNSCLFVI